MLPDVLDQELWIVGQSVPDSAGSLDAAWLFQGVFATEELAVQACHSPLYFVGPAILNETLPAEATSWPGHYYPAERGQP